MTLGVSAMGVVLGALMPTMPASAGDVPSLPLFQLAFASDTVTVEGLTLGGKVVWFGAAQSLADDDVVEIR